MSDTPAAEAPKAKATKPKVPRKAPAHPPISELIVKAIVALKDRKGSSVVAIKKWISSAEKVRSVIARQNSQPRPAAAGPRAGPRSTVRRQQRHPAAAAPGQLSSAPRIPRATSSCWHLHCCCAACTLTLLAAPTNRHVLQGLSAGWEKRANASVRGLVEKGKLVKVKGHYKLAAATKKAAEAKPKAAKATPKKKAADSEKKKAPAKKKTPSKPKADGEKPKKKATPKKPKAAKPAGVAKKKATPKKPKAAKPKAAPKKPAAKKATPKAKKAAPKAKA